MARDYTKYTVEGLGENLNKRQLVFTVVKDWAEKNNPSLDEIQATFPDEVQGGKGFIVKESEVKGISKFKIVVSTNEAQIIKITKQLEKQVDVLKAYYHSESDMLLQDLAVSKFAENSIN